LNSLVYWLALLFSAAWSLGIVVWTAVVFREWMKSPSWHRPFFGMTLCGVAVTGIVILLWVQWLWPGKITISSLWSPWFYIFYLLLGVGILSLIYRSWKNADSSDIKIDIVFEVLFFIAFIVALIVLVSSEVSDNRYARPVQNTLRLVGRINNVYGLVTTLFLYCFIVWLILQRSVILGILIGLLLGAGILFWGVRIHVST
jgi:hypothetical protein